MTGPVRRSLPELVNPFLQVRPVAAGRGQLRASLLIAHGLTRLFFRYFPVVGDTIDARLLETLGAADIWDGANRRVARNVLRRFGEALHDGHQFVFNFGTADTIGYLPVFLDEIGGLPVVRTSGIETIHPGDTLVSIDGRSTVEIFAEELARSSAATPGYRFDIASRELRPMIGPRTVGLRDPDGGTRSVTIDPQPLGSLLGALNRAFDRPSGPLTSFGASDLYYLNVATAAAPTTEVVRAALAEATSRGARGLILDMRGFPGGVDHYEVAARLINRPFVSAQFERVRYVGPDYSELVPGQFQFSPLRDPSWKGPIVLITGPHAVSAAENFMQMLVGAGRLTAIVGQRSAGTNGNLTGAQVPNAFGFLYTGTEVRNPDGSVFHGVGIVPDVPVALSAADLRDGIDRDLIAAIQAMRDHLRP